MTPKTAAERAQEALDVAERRVKKLEEKGAKLKKEQAAAEAELERARDRRDYLGQNPDLPQQVTKGDVSNSDPEF